MNSMTEIDEIDYLKLTKVETFEIGRDYRVKDESKDEVFLRVIDVSAQSKNIWLKLKNMTYPEEPLIVSCVDLEKEKLVCYPWKKKNSFSPKITADDYLLF